MPLTGPQVARLVTEISEQWTFQKLSLSAANLEFQLKPALTVAEAACELISHFNSRIPPRDGEVLDEVYAEGNARLRSVVDALRRPDYYAPTGQALDAIMLGRTAFVDRDPLRSKVASEFLNPSPYSTRVLVVRGDEPCGKSYSWEFLRHMAWSALGAVPLRLPLKDTGYTPRELVEAAFGLLTLDPLKLPPLKDRPQLARIEPLINAFKGQLPRMQGPPYLLVIDDLNDPSVIPATVETAIALAESVEEIRAQYLWVVLLGYNVPITGELRQVAQDDASFPDPACVARHFEAMAAAGPKPIGAAKARQYADLLFSKYAELDKAAMTELTPRLEELGEKLRLGQQP